LLLAIGLIVGEGLFGMAGIHFTHVGPPLAVFGEDFAPLSRTAERACSPSSITAPPGGQD
jgi:hypothetical protein